MFSMAFRIAAIAINLFILACMARIILGWISFPASFRMEGAERFLRALTDWWFRPFSGIRFLRRGQFDFTPTFALVALVLLATVCTMLADIGRIAFGILAGVILSAAWSAFAFFLVILIILLVVRLVAYALRLNTLNPFFRAVEALSDPALFRMKRILFGKRIVRYQAGLLGTIAPLALLWLAGTLLCGYLSGLLSGLPF